MAKKILVLGATGAMGQYLVPELLSLGYEVTGVSLDEKTSDNPALRYIKANCKAEGILDSLLKEGFDGIVDFMTYHTEEFRNTYTKLLDSTDHYIYLSSCRVFADAPPIREDSPQLLNVSDDQAYLATDDYSLYKAREENILRESAYKNWTIVRPATTYSRGRFQLVTLEASTVIHRMQAGKTIVLPAEAMDKQATLSWGGDVAKMLARLMFLDEAYRNDYNVATGEHNSWADIAAIYNEILPFRYVTVPMDDYLNIIGPGSMPIRYQLIYARMFQRITDNSKILRATGLKQSDLTTLRDGLRREYEASRDMNWARFAGDERNTRMDAYLKEHGIK